MPDAGCFDYLNWRCDLAGEAEPSFAALERHFAARGFEARGRHPALYSFRRPDFAEIVVLRTGRVQIRVDYLIARERREDIARAAHGELREVLASLEAPP